MPFNSFNFWLIFPFIFGLYWLIPAKYNQARKVFLVLVNSVVNHNSGSNVLLAGAPAIVKKEDCQPWYVRDGEAYVDRVKRVENLRKEMGL